MISLEGIVLAQEKMRGIVHETPLDYSKTLSDLSGNEVYLKLENLQKTGSFKVRGSYNKMMNLNQDELQNGVVAASAGNHAQGVAYSSKMLGIPCTIVMPKGAPIGKIQATKRYGAKVELYGSGVDEALVYAKKIQEETGAAFVHPFDDSSVIEGQGTIGLEILRQLPDIDAVICPVGGGGLIAGVAYAVKKMKPSIQVYGVEALACSSMSSSLKERKPVMVEAMPTMADGIAVKKPGDLTFQLVQEYVDDIFCVDEMEIARTMLMVLERNKLLVEGSGACALAALLYRKVPLKDKKVVTVLSGGNVDVSFISRIIERGMVEAGRYAYFSIVLMDKPGQLEKVLEIIAELQANVMQISLHHIGEHIFPGSAELKLTIETRDSDHIREVFQALNGKGYHVLNKISLHE